MGRGALYFLGISFFIQADEIPWKETLAQVKEMISKEEKGAYLSFSEAELRIACGQGNCVWDQLEMEQVLALEGKNILKSLSLPYTALNGHRPQERWAVELFDRIGSAWGSSYAPFSSSLFSTAYRKDSIRFFQFLQSQNLLIVGDQDILPSTKDLLLGSDVPFISVEECGSLELERYTVVLLVTRSTGKGFILKWLDEELPVFIIDLGGLSDSLAHWSTENWRKWIQKSDELKILFTSALIPYKFEERKREYIKSLATLKDYGFIDQTYIVEAGPYSPLSFFDEYSAHLFYANTNDASFINKGVNEARSSLAAFDYFNFNDEDMIVKLTGRYLFNTDQFLRFVASHPEVDAFANPNATFGITTGCFAMRGKYYRQMLHEIDFADMEKNLIDIERVTEKFFLKMASVGAKVVYLDKIGITANVANAVIEEW